MTTRVNGNPSGRSLTDVGDDSPGHGSNVGSHAQAIRPDYIDESRAFDRKRNPDERPPLDRDPRLRM